MKNAPSWTCLSPHSMCKSTLRPLREVVENHSFHPCYLPGKPQDQRVVPAIRAKTYLIQPWSKKKLTRSPSTLSLEQHLSWGTHIKQVPKSNTKVWLEKLRGWCSAQFLLRLGSFLQKKTSFFGNLPLSPCEVDWPWPHRHPRFSQPWRTLLRPKSQRFEQRPTNHPGMLSNSCTLTELEAISIASLLHQMLMPESIPAALPPPLLRVKESWIWGQEDWRTRQSKPNPPAEIGRSRPHNRVDSEMPRKWNVIFILVDNTSCEPLRWY